MSPIQTSALLILFINAGVAFSACTTKNVDFIVLDGDATLKSIEDDIRADLAPVGFNVTGRFLAKAEFNKAMQAGDFHLCFSETWGPPYDPHSYANSWFTNNEAYHMALKGLPAPITYDVLKGKVNAVQSSPNVTDREAKWKEILSTLHSSATELPFSGKRIPAIINSRLSGYQNGLQQFDYPVHKLQLSSGSKNIKVSPGAQGGLFTGVGRLDPHSYRPNEFFANNWVYEGLVEYGPDGTILPSLATSWTAEDNGAGQKFTFTLRENVKFHDGAAWDCSVAKMNFDNVLAGFLTTADYHGWYGLPGAINGSSCVGGKLEVTTNTKYYPLLQELTYIRPLRMLSPNMFVGGTGNNYLTQNSCPVGWGNATHNGVTVVCKGTLGVSGTGRWKYLGTVKDGSDNVQEVIFQRNTDHWEGTPANSVQNMTLVRYSTASAVKTAMINGALDAIIGAGVLEPVDVEEFRTQRTSTFNTYLTEPLQNRIIILNTNKVPLSDLKTRTTLIHAVNKAAIIKKELGILARPVDNLFPTTAPYCDVDLTPKWDYDLEKAKLLNCPVDKSVVTKSLSFSSLTTWEGDTKAVYEVGYAIALGIYDDQTQAYAEGCSVTSKISTRRAITVEFTAFVPSANVAAAQEKATVLDGTVMASAITKAKTALNKPNVAGPEVANIQVAPAESNSDSDNLPTYGIVLIVILGVLVFLLIAGVGHMTMREKAGNPVFMPLPQADAEATTTTHMGTTNGKEHKEQAAPPVQIKLEQGATQGGSGNAEADRSCFSKTSC